MDASWHILVDLLPLRRALSADPQGIKDLQPAPRTPGGSPTALSSNFESKLESHEDDSKAPIRKGWTVRERRWTGNDG